MPMNRFMEGNGPPVSPESQITRRMRSRYNAARYGSPDVIDAFFFSTPLRPLAASGTDIFSIPVQEDAEFVCEWISGILMREVGGVPEWTLPTGGLAAATFAADGAFTGAATIRITDTGSSRQMMDRFLYWHTVVGTAQKPNYLAAPKHFRPNSTIQVEVTNLVAVTAQWQIVFGGVKIYRVGRS